MAELRNYNVGELRSAQILYSYGVGSLIDLPYFSVMLMGLDFWETKNSREIEEPRLLQSIRKQFQYATVKKLKFLPMPEGSLDAIPGEQLVGVPVKTFPRWFRCPACDRLSEISPSNIELEADSYKPENSRYAHKSCKHSKGRKYPTALPVRRLVACRNGHMDDFPWSYFVHKGESSCKGPFRWRENGVSGSVDEIVIYCDGCDASQNLVKAFSNPESLGNCNGKHPHLGKDFVDKKCDAELKPIVLGASNSWFSISRSTLSIPGGESELSSIIDLNWDKISDIESSTEIKTIKKFIEGLNLYSDEEIFSEIQKRKNPSGTAVKEGENERDLKAPEWKILSSSPIKNDKDFKTTIVNTPDGYERFFSRILKVERLREVTALLGFSRLESLGEFGDYEELPATAPISKREIDWLPSIEVKGEGIFFQFNEVEIRKWLKKENLNDLQAKFLKSHEAFRKARNKPEPHSALFPDMRYILLHSFSHAIMRQLSLDCGYSSSSLKERIYSRNEGDVGGAQAGVLIYTSASDSEGTLGGLVRLAEPDFLKRTLDQMKEDMSICSSDPLCSEHEPEANGLAIHGSSCHSCLLAPETACESGNKYLDRKVLVNTIRISDIGFF